MQLNLLFAFLLPFTVFSLKNCKLYVQYRKKCIIYDVKNCALDNIKDCPIINIKFDYFCPIYICEKENGVTELKVKKGVVINRLGPKTEHL